MDFSALTHDQDIASGTGGCSPAKQRPLILVIEDDRDNLLLLYHLVKSLGCDVLLAREGQAGLAIIKEASPDLILLDIVMPRLSGFDVLQHLQQAPTARTIPIIAVTGMASAEEKQRLLQAGCSDYLCKPYLIHDLQTLICQHLSLQLIPQFV